MAAMMVVETAEWMVDLRVALMVQKTAHRMAVN